MRSGSRSAGIAAVLTAAVCVVTLTGPGCSGTKPTPRQTVERYSQELRDAIAKNVVEERRKTQMLSIVDQMEALQLRFGQETADFVRTYRKLNADYDATRPQFDQLFSDYNAQRTTARAEALDLHFQLAALAEAEEWGAIGKAEGKLYERAIEARPSSEGTT
jgi:hypothetical protein